MGKGSYWKLPQPAKTRNIPRLLEHRRENQAATGWTVDDLDIAEARNIVAEAVRIGRLNEPGTGGLAPRARTAPRWQPPPRGSGVIR